MLLLLVTVVPLVPVVSTPCPYVKLIASLLPPLRNVTELKGSFAITIIAYLLPGVRDGMEGPYNNKLLALMVC